jgi:TRAP-type C4-dicarboxylate transport system permease small subunit
MQKFIRLIDSMSKIGGYLSAILILLMTGMILVHVFARRILGAPILSGDEVCSYLLVWVVFFGLAYTMKEKGHVRVDVLLSRFSGKSYNIFQKLCTLLGIFYSFIFIVGNFLLIRQFYLNRTISTMDLQIPLVIPGIGLLLGSLLLFLQMIAELLRSDEDSSIS